MSECLRSFESMSFREQGSESSQIGSMKREPNALMALHARALDLLHKCSCQVPPSLADEIKSLVVKREPDQLTTLLSRALDLLSRCSRYVLTSLKDEIEGLANDTGRTTLMPVRVERVGGVVVIDPYNTTG